MLSIVKSRNVHTGLRQGHCFLSCQVSPVPRNGSIPVPVQCILAATIRESFKFYQIVCTIADLRFW